MLPSKNRWGCEVENSKTHVYPVNVLGHKTLSLSCCLNIMSNDRSTTFNIECTVSSRSETVHDRVHPRHKYLTIGATYRHLTNTSGRVFYAVYMYRRQSTLNFRCSSPTL